MCNAKTTLTLNHLELIDTTCEESLELFEDDEALKQILGVYDKPFTPKKKWLTCAMISTKKKDGEEESNEIDMNKEDYNPEFLKQNVHPLGDTMDIHMDVNNKEKVIKIRNFLNDEEQEDLATLLYDFL